MSHSLLFHEDPALPPEARWMLWKWSQHIGLDQAEVCTVRRLYGQLRLTLRQGQQALNALKEQGAIVASPMQEGRGRPRNEYRIAPKLQKDLSAHRCQKMPLTSVIEWLGGFSNSLEEALLPSLGDGRGEGMSVEDVSTATKPTENENDQQGQGKPDNLLDGEARKTRLTLANRWLLMVMLAHADITGTVIGLSHARLQRLSGISLSRLQSQRRKFIELGILADYRLGRGRGVQDGNVVSSYRFDLGHPVFGQQARLAVNMQLLPPFFQETAICDGIIEALFVVAHALSDPEQRDNLKHAGELLPPSDYIAPLADWLVSEYNDSAVAWLRNRVHLDAMCLLSTAWQRLADGKAGPETPVEVVIQDISEAFAGAVLSAPTPAHIVKGLPAEKRQGQHYPPHIILLYALAHHLASKLQDRLLREVMREHDHIDFSALTFHLLPPDPPAASSVSEAARYRVWRLIGFVPKDEAEAFERAETPFYCLVHPPKVTVDLKAWLRQLDASNHSDTTQDSTRQEEHAVPPADSAPLLADKRELGTPSKHRHRSRFRPSGS